MLRTDKTIKTVRNFFIAFIQVGLNCSFESHIRWDEKKYTTIQNEQMKMLFFINIFPLK